MQFCLLFMVREQFHVCSVERRRGVVPLFYPKSLTSQESQTRTPSETYRGCATTTNSSALHKLAQTNYTEQHTDRVVQF